MTTGNFSRHRFRFRPVSKLSLNGAAIVGAMIALLCQVQPANAGPFADFFHNLKNAFKNPQKKPVIHRTVAPQHSADRVADDSRNDTRIKASGPPNERNTRRTARSSGGEASGQLQYGTPVPGKKGFVTSPFSPDAGYIDVRGFGPGTPVKDPYSGKTFLTP